MKEQKDALLNGRDLNGAGAADCASTNSNWGESIAIKVWPSLPLATPKYSSNVGITQ